MSAAEPRRAPGPRLCGAMNGMPGLVRVPECCRRRARPQHQDRVFAARGRAGRARRGRGRTRRYRLSTLRTHGVSARAIAVALSAAWLVRMENYEHARSLCNRDPGCPRLREARLQLAAFAASPSPGRRGILACLAGASVAHPRGLTQACRPINGASHFSLAPMSLEALAKTEAAHHARARASSDTIGGCAIRASRRGRPSTTAGHECRSRPIARRPHSS
jgi:hypothetical protein